MIRGCKSCPIRSQARRGARIGIPGAILLGCLLGLTAHVQADDGLETDADAPRVEPSLAAHSAEFAPAVYRVADGVYSAVGFALANSILIEGDDGVVIVDVTESVETARAILAEFRKITDKPIKALVYTHNHGDHVFGGPGFVSPDALSEVEVFAHETTNEYINRVVNIIRPGLMRRTARMFGHLLPEGESGVVNAGIGPFLAVGAHGRGGTTGLIRPTRTFADELEIEVAGIRMRLVHAPGETNDQIFVWLPDRKVLLPGDNVYKAFPNLYTIRGTPYRDVSAWVRSLDKMRDLEPEHVVPSHTRPFSGAGNIREILTAYRDAIQYVHDQTLRGINRGQTSDELAGSVKLPPHLAQHPYLQEHYGTVEWSVRSIFNGYLGWFDGDAATLSPVAPNQRARNLAELAGGPWMLMATAQAALDQKDFSWAAELAGHSLELEPGNDTAARIKAAALRALGERSVSPNGRHYYLTSALELEGHVDASNAIALRDPELLKAFPIANVLESLTVRLDPLRSADSDIAVGFVFPDEETEYTLHVRRGVAEFQSRLPKEPDLQITASSDDFLEVLLGLSSIETALATGSITLEGNPALLGSFFGLFDRE